MMIFEKAFDRAAEDYEQSRPLYGKELYGRIFQYKPINAGCSVLEIGIGTGKASQPVLETGCHFIGLEPGEHLAKLAKEKLQGYPNFSLSCQTFQDYVCPEGSFDLIYAATAFHWIPEEYGYRQVYKLLKQGGAFARFAYHAGADKTRPDLAAKIEECYQKYMNNGKEYREYSEEDAKILAKTAIKYGFTDAEYHLYSSTKDFTAKEYLTLLKTYPDHVALEEPAREKLFDGIYSAIVSSGGIITVYYTIDLELARKP